MELLQPRWAVWGLQNRLQMKKLQGCRKEGVSSFCTAITAQEPQPWELSADKDVLAAPILSALFVQALATAHQLPTSSLTQHSSFSVSHALLLFIQVWKAGSVGVDGCRSAFSNLMCLTLGPKATDSLHNMWQIGFPNSFSIWCLELSQVWNEVKLKCSDHAVIAVVSSCFVSDSSSKVYYLFADPRLLVGWFPKQEGQYQPQAIGIVGQRWAPARGETDCSQWHVFFLSTLFIFQRDQTISKSLSNRVWMMSSVVQLP